MEKISSLSEPLIAQLEKKHGVPLSVITEDFLLRLLFGDTEAPNYRENSQVLDEYLAGDMSVEDAMDHFNVDNPHDLEAYVRAYRSSAADSGSIIEDLL